MKEIKLENSNKKVIVDNEDYETISKTKWRIDSDGYARGRQSVRMHRLIMNTPKGMETDHINEDKLDNRKCNLRICTQHQNQINRGKQKNNTSGYKGVSRKRKKWVAQIKFMGKIFRNGLYDDVIEAAHAYDKKAKELFGEFAKLNFPE